MTSFALFYKRQDFSQLAAEAQNVNLTVAEKKYGQALWNAGLKNWSNAPQAPDAQACVITPDQPTVVAPGVIVTQLPDGTWQICDPDIRILVISANNVSKQQTIDWLHQIGTEYTGALYMYALADDMVMNAVEPWPPA